MLWRGRNALTFGRGTTCSLAIILPCGVGGIDQLESFGFLGRKFCIRNVEILSVGKIAEFAKFAGGERRKSPDRFSLIRAAASYVWLPSMAFVERLRGQVPLNFDESEVNGSRFATRAWDCGERVRCPTIFSKSLIRHLMTGAGIVANRGRIEMLGSLVTLFDYGLHLSRKTFQGGDLHWRLLH